MQVAREYVAPLIGDGIDVLVLGCTHNPLLKPLRCRLLGSDVQFLQLGQRFLGDAIESVEVHTFV